MRNPHGFTVLFALESAMDELAVELNIDPVAMRKRNDAQANPISGIPFTGRSLNRCLDAAAERFGWSKRTPQPGSMRDGDWLIGWGCASCFYPTHMMPTAGRLTVAADGRTLFETAVADVGQGSATILGQIIARRLGLPTRMVEVRVGDTAFPVGVHAGASMTTASASNTAIKAADQILAKLGLPAGNGNDREGLVRLQEAFVILAVDQLVELAEWSPPGADGDALRNLAEGKGVGSMTEVKTGSHRTFSWGAQFVEVRVHARTREIRVPRVVGAFTGGYIVNPRLARSQLIGATIWGIGGALLEATKIDEKRARYTNDNLADYEIASNADIGEIDIILLPETNAPINMLNAKGIGELANAGTAAALASAIWHATGTRIYDLPINIDRLFTAESN